MSMIFWSVLIHLSHVSLLFLSGIQRTITLNWTRRTRVKVRVRVRRNLCYRKRMSQKAWNWTRPLLPSQYQPPTSHRSRGNEADPQRTPPSLQHPASQSGWLPKQLLLVRTLTSTGPISYLINPVKNRMFLHVILSKHAHSS